MLVIGIMGIVVVLMAIQFKSIKPEYGIMISVVGCAFIFLYSLVRVNEIVEMVERLAGITSVSREYIKIILKIKLYIATVMIHLFLISGNIFTLTFLV